MDPTTCLHLIYNSKNYQNKKINKCLLVIVWVVVSGIEGDEENAEALKKEEDINYFFKSQL